jgi:predicted esterase
MALRRILLIVLLLGALAPAQSTRQSRPTPIVTRIDLARAYLRVEEVLQLHPINAVDRARVHRAMDTAAYYFFSGNHSAAVRSMNELSDSLRGATRPDLRSFVESLRVRVGPQIANKHRPSIFTIRFAPLFDVPIEQSVDMRVVIRSDDAESRVVFDQKLTFSPDGPLPSVSTKQPHAAPGRYRVQLVAADGQTFELGPWYVVAKSLDVLRVANENRLRDLDTRQPQIYQAWVACLSRNSLLMDRPPENDLAAWLSDPISLEREVDSEVKALLDGRDPFVGRIGEYFRAIPAGAMSIPARIYAPPQAKDPKPLPVVIALHGASGDEALYTRGYGAGQIKRLADQHGFIVVAPSTYWVIPNPAALPGILAALEMDYTIDPKRVYVVGHSLGAMAAGGMAMRHPKELAAAVLIAGGRIGTDAICPTMVFGGELDPVFPAAKLRTMVDDARAAGWPVEYRLVPDAGHVLICNEVLTEAIDWLLKH